MYSIEFKARAVVHYCEFLKSLRKVAQRYNIGKVKPGQVGERLG